MNSTHRARRWIWFMWTSVIKFLAAERILREKIQTSRSTSTHTLCVHDVCVCIPLNWMGMRYSQRRSLLSSKRGYFSVARRFLLMCAALAWRNVRLAVLAFLQRPWRLGDWLIDWLALGFHENIHRLCRENFANGTLSAWCISVASQPRRWRMDIFYTLFESITKIDNTHRPM